MKRWMLILTLALGIMLVLGAARFVYAQGGDGEGDEHGGGEGGAAGEEWAPLRGAALYAEFCQACHGPRGEAVAAGPAFAAITHDPAATYTALTEGLDSDPTDGAAMPVYAKEAGGVLDERQINDLIAYMDSWATGDTPPLPEPNIGPVESVVPGYPGDVRAGAVLYARSCYGCHGSEGKGRGKANFPAFEFNVGTLRAVREGTDSPVMPGFGMTAGGPLDDEALQDLEAFMVSWSLDKGEDPAGLNTLVLLSGAVAIVLVGSVYLARMRRGEE